MNATEFCDVNVTEFCDVNVTEFCDVNVTEFCDVNVTEFCDVNVTELCDVAVTELYDLKVTEMPYLDVTELCDVNVAFSFWCYIWSIIATDVSENHKGLTVNINLRDYGFLANLPRTILNINVKQERIYTPHGCLGVTLIF